MKKLGDNIKGFFFGVFFTLLAFSFLLNAYQYHKAQDSVARISAGDGYLEIDRLSLNDLFEEVQ